MTTSDTEIVTGELVPADPAPTNPITLFGTSDPRVALERMAEIARLLVGVVRDRNLVKKIAGNEYLLAPGWAVLAGMTGLTPYTVWVNPLEDGTGYSARVEVRRVSDGAIVSAAEQVCTRAESKWVRADDHALVGMAQTRATSRALRGPLMQIVELAGYQGTPAEEMPTEAVTVEPDRDPGAIPAQHRPTKEQQARIFELLTKLEETAPDVDWKQKARELARMPYELLTKTTVTAVIEGLEAELAERETTAA
jgi:hypothetical protein